MNRTIASRRQEEVSRIQRGLGKIPDGSFTLSKRPGAWPTGVWDQAVGGYGPYVLTISGKKYLDWMCALGALTVGHTHPDVTRAVSMQVEVGALFSLPHWLEAVVADRLCEVIPCAEAVRVVKTGSEACAAAVRIARMATGRDVILTTASSYHGWHDWHAVTKPRHPGVPSGLASYIDTFDYNDWDGFRRCFDGIFDETQRYPAAVMLEPVQGAPPLDGFLERLKHFCAGHGTLLIFDEMLCGGRLAVGGAQELYRVTPDLATFGKAFGCGYPFAFVAGRADLMQHAWPISGTFSGDALALTAADAMLDVYKTEPVIEKLYRNGGLAKASLLQVAERYDLPVVFHGHDPRFWFEFPAWVDNRLAKSVFVQQAAMRGQLVHPAVIFGSAAMSPQEAATGAAALAEAFDVTCAAIKDGGVTLASLLTGEQYQDSVR